MKEFEWPQRDVDIWISEFPVVISIRGKQSGTSLNPPDDAKQQSLLYCFLCISCQTSLFSLNCASQTFEHISFTLFPSCISFNFLSFPDFSVLFSVLHLPEERSKQTDLHIVAGAHLHIVVPQSRGAMVANQQIPDPK